MSATLSTFAVGTTIQRVEVGAYQIATDAPESDVCVAGYSIERPCSSATAA